MSNNVETQKNRIEFLDIAKGIGIFLVVYAHSRAPQSHYIYLFHMPLFFIISGYLFNEEKGLMPFIKGKFKSLFIPFLINNLMFLILKGIVKHYKAYVYLQHIGMLIGVQKEGSFLGATWFLSSLFWVSIIYKFLHFCLNRLKVAKTEIILLGLSVLLAIAGFSYTFPFKISRTLILSMFFSFGVTFKQYKDIIHRIDSAAFVVLSVVLLFLCSNNANMGENKYDHKILFVWQALAGSYLVLKFALAIDKNNEDRLDCCLSRAFKFLGKYSIFILIYQFVFFKIIVAIQMFITTEHVTFADLYDVGVLYDISNGRWIIYLLLGIIGPISIGMLYRFFRKKVRKELLTLY